MIILLQKTNLELKYDIVIWFLSLLIPDCPLCIAHLPTHCSHPISSVTCEFPPLSASLLC